MPNYTTKGHQPIITWVTYHSYIIFTQIVNTACCSVSNILLSILHLCPFTLRHSLNPNSTVSIDPIDVIRVKSYVLLSSLGYADDLFKA